MGLKEKLLNKLKDERGSLSLLIFSLFILTLFTALIFTDVSTVYLAKRSLTQATEAAVQRGSRNLDEEAYYTGKYTLTSVAMSLAGLGNQDPGIPINCAKGSRDVYQALSDWSDGGPALNRINLKSMQIDDLQCDGFQIAAITSADAELPFKLPFISIEKVHITATIGAFDERANTNNFNPFA
jgi:hypothetical protein